jgi:hypothetical protein
MICKEFCFVDFYFIFVFFFTEIVSLIDDMHACANRIIDLVKCKKPNTKGVMPEDALVANPQKLCYVIKQATREGAVGEWRMTRRIN